MMSFTVILTMLRNADRCALSMRCAPSCVRPDAPCWPHRACATTSRCCSLRRSGLSRWPRQPVRSRRADGEVHLERAVTTAIVDALAQGNVAVTAPAGEGKSVALRDAALRLRAAGHPVVFLAADDAQPHLEHTLAQVFERWGEAGFLFIDGFDSLRLGPGRCAAAGVDPAAARYLLARSHRQP